MWHIQHIYSKQDLDSIEQHEVATTLRELNSLMPEGGSMGALELCALRELGITRPIFNLLGMRYFDVGNDKPSAMVVVREAYEFLRRFRYFIITNML